MHEKCFKIDFFVNFRKLQKKLPICKKKYAEILDVDRAVVTSVEKKFKSTSRIFFGSAKVAPDCNAKKFAELLREIEKIALRLQN